MYKSVYATRSRTLYLLAFVALSQVATTAYSRCQTVASLPREQTYCNPIDLPYRFQLEKPSRREAADPTMVVYRNEYWLFPSKSGGYWHSRDLLAWHFVKASGYPIEDYAPTVMVFRNKLYLTAGSTNKLFVTEDPNSGIWTEAAEFQRSYGDPDLFVDDDGRVYVYFGVSDKDVLHVAELDPQNGFKELQSTAIPTSGASDERGWEVPGDFNELITKKPYVEGSWMTKHEEKYYLQFAAPGTQFKTYGDGILVAANPMGPFSYAPYSPFSFKPTGFISGAGHSSTFAGLDEQMWHVSTMTISVRHMFERRLGLFPSRFLADGQLIADTYLGDYPHYIGGNRGLVGWMLLSRKKTVTASSSEGAHLPENAVDEDVRTWWSAKTGDPGEWLTVDLGKTRLLQAIQINFADEDSTTLGLSSDTYRYLVDISRDSTHWKTVVDHSRSGKDAPHDYEVLSKAQSARYVRIRNVHSPNDAKFSISDLRVFGNGNEPLPPKATDLRAVADSEGTRRATITWHRAAGAEFYIIRLGASPDNLSQNYQVYDGATSLEVRSLNSNVIYYLSIDSVNDRGITRGSDIFTLQAIRAQE